MNRKPFHEPFDLATAERRRMPRISVEHQLGPRDGSSIESGQVVTSRLVDISDGGVGVETTIPLPVGAIMVIAGELHSSRFCVGLWGPVRVAHCRPLDNGAFRSGLAFAGASCGNILCDHELGDADGTARADWGLAGKLRGTGGDEVCIPSRLWGELLVTLSEA